MVHKLYIDSRAGVGPSIDPSNFTWASQRPIHIGRSRAWIDSVHLYNSFGSITEHNRNVYVAEELVLLTVLPSATKIYITEMDAAGVVTERIATLTAGVHDGPSLATALATAMTTATSTYSTSYSANAGMGVIGISVSGTSTAFSIVSRAYLLGIDTWAGLPLAKSQLEDASDVLGTTVVTHAGATVTLSLGHGLAYRKIPLAIGSYSFDSLKTELQTQLNAGTSLGAASYTITKNEATGTLTIANSATPLKFHIYPGDYLAANPYAFQGHAGPFLDAGEVTGFTGTAVLPGNSVTGARHINTQAYGTLFICSSLGSHNDSIGPTGASTIARKVTIDQPSGGAIHDFHSLPYDYLSLEAQSICGITFRVTDWAGRTVPMGHWSLSIIIVPEEDF